MKKIPLNKTDFDIQSKSNENGVTYCRNLNTIIVSFIFFCENSEYSSSLEKFNLGINQKELYPENSKVVDELINDMATGTIDYVGK